MQFKANIYHPEGWPEKAIIQIWTLFHGHIESGRYIDQWDQNWTVLLGVSDHDDMF